MHERKRGLIISIRNGRLSIGDKLLVKDFELDIYHSDRISISGANGSGKSTLVKEFQYKVRKNLEGMVSYGDSYKTLYLDQKYDLINTKATLLENFDRFHPKLKYEDKRRILAGIGFQNKIDINKQANKLSGGEVAKFTFAMISSKKIDLLILDEPTNNLDIDSIAYIEEVIKGFDGTLIVISHDDKFLNNIDIKKRLRIENNSIIR